MNKAPLHERIEKALNSGRWMSLDEILMAVKSSSKSYLKMTLLAMFDVVEWRRKLSDNPHAPENTWRWEFRLKRGNHESSS